MYYEEKIINGVLCWRGTPAGEWRECTPQRITIKLVEAQQQSVDSVKQIKDEIRTILDYLDMCSYANFTAEKYDITKRRLRELSAGQQANHEICPVCGSVAVSRNDSTSKYACTHCQWTGKLS